MNLSRLVVIVAAFVVSGAAFAAVPSVTPAQKAAICGKRTTCVVTAVHNAGAQSVAEMHFGLKDKSDDAPDDGCRLDDSGEKKDGGTEYWLLGTKPLKVLAFCNDGYGAAGMGEDTVTFGNNRMTHEQDGGSAWRWSNTQVYTLSPFRTVSTDGCSYNDTGSDTGTETRTYETNFHVVAIAKNPGEKWGDDDGVGCLDTKPADFLTQKPYPVAKGVMAFPVPGPANGVADLTNLPDNTMLGSCSWALTTDSKAGFLPFGKPAEANKTAYVRMMSPNPQVLMVQIYDPIAAKTPVGKTWISGSHLEVWAGEMDVQGPLKRSDLHQVAIDLDGTLHVVGKAEAPKVRHWQGKDEQGRPVTVMLLSWSDGSLFAVGTAVSYSQAENGKQARLVSNTPMVHGLPVLIPGSGAMQTECAIKSGTLVMK